MNRLLTHRLLQWGRQPQRLAGHVIAILLALMSAQAISGPGAHGPNGEHLDSPPTVRAASALPRVDAATDAFEIVGELRNGELAILVDRYESNEPVLHARLEVESGALKAVAAFRAEQGDYVVTDAALLKALAAPGEHGLVFTLVAGQDSDLLEGTLVTAGGTAATTGQAARAAQAADRGDAHARDGHVHEHEHSLQRAAWVGAGIVALGLVGAIAWWRQRPRGTAHRPGGLS